MAPAGQFVDPDRIRAMLLMEDPYLYLMMATAFVVGSRGCGCCAGSACARC